MYTKPNTLVIQINAIDFPLYNLVTRPQSDLISYFGG